jgi:CDP-diacylglycerol--serine O-phosphatidyltransferase
LSPGTELLAALRFAAPHLLTAVRIVLAALAIVAASRQQVGPAATLLLLGLVTDVLDGACARRLGVAVEFGKLFDFFADYLYFVVAPFTVSLSLAEPAGTFTIMLLSLPCVFAALRYARKAGVSETEYPGIPGSPGVPTIAYALFVIALALLRRDGAIGRESVTAVLTFGAPILAFLMTVRTRYPKLSVYPWILVPILVGLAIMPFVLTSVLSAATLGLIVVYVVIGPPLVQRNAARDRCC